LVGKVLVLGACGASEAVILDAQELPCYVVPTNEVRADEVHEVASERELAAAMWMFEIDYAIYGYGKRRIGRPTTT
jgi:hypothetical protein